MLGDFLDWKKERAKHSMWPFKLSRKSKRKSNRGQISIFFAITLTLLITVVAFVVNIGIFVKSKINLQNAVDAAAWAGAAVQARQLTNIAYVNWEMRNTYKEWMFKYYILGQISNSNTDIAGFGDPNDQRIDYRLQKFQASEPTSDEYNIPSICIKFTGAEGNICNIYTTPGLPRTNTAGAVGIDDTFNRAINELVKTKSENCVDRSILNLRTATLWAYGGGSANTSTLFENAPVIAAQRTGAWTEAIELALRIRNLERLVNQPPQPSPVCASGGSCPIQISSLEQADQSLPAFNERTIKAFWSAYRNLGTNDGRGPNEMKDSFRLTELSPQLNSVPPEVSLNNVLIPVAYEKFYLDLQLYLVNFVTFFSTFIPKTRQDAGTSGIPVQGECALSKTGLPVPNYPLGFIKNPSVLTYYAVRGDAEFNGLFNPFQTPITLTAYAAAKPYGGRIGPHLFRVTPDSQSITPRTQRSFPYISGLDSQIFQFGQPVPSTTDFWVQTPDDIIGGIPFNPNQVRFVIPNMVFDVPENESNIGRQDGGAGANIQIIAQNTADTGTAAFATNTPEQAGLYDAEQFALMRQLLPDIVPDIVTREEVDAAMINVRKPTRYDALNYMIPTVPRTGNETLDPSFTEENISPVTFVRAALSPDGRNHYQLYAPLFQPGLLYEVSGELERIIGELTVGGTAAVDKFLTALNEVAETSRANDRATAQTLYEGASDNIHDQPGDPTNPTCASLAGQFNFFFKRAGFGPGCVAGGDAQSIVVNAFQDKRASTPQFDVAINPTYVETTDPIVNLQNNSLLKSGYAPGPRHGATTGGIFEHPFIPSVTPTDMHRNFYSTKFVAITSLASGTSNSYLGSSFDTYSEGTFTFPADLSDGAGFRFNNPLNQSDLDELDPDNLGLTH